MSKKKFGKVVHACNSSAEEVERGLTRQCSLNGEFQTSKRIRDFVSKQQQPKVDADTHKTYTYTHTPYKINEDFFKGIRI